MNKSETILFISNKENQCGVYQFGYRIGSVIEKSRKYRFLYREISDKNSLKDLVFKENPGAIIYNHHPATLPWLDRHVTCKFPIPQIGIIHEVTQVVANSADNSTFDYHIAPDPTLLLRNPIVFKTGRLVASYNNRFPTTEIPRIGSFGFGTDGKGLEYLVAKVQESFDVAEIRLHIPAANFGDFDGKLGRNLVDRCKSLIFKRGIILSASHEFLHESALLDFLGSNTCNVFVYNQMEGRGISSTPDYALGVQRPIAIRRTQMMRHLLDSSPSICLEDHTLREIIDFGTKPIRRFAYDWCEANLIWDYERIISKILCKYKPTKPLFPWSWSKVFKRKLTRSRKNNSTGASVQEVRTNWFGQDDYAVFDARSLSGAKAETYSPVMLDDSNQWNRILNNQSRETYCYTISKLFQWFPDLMARKISRANVQQAFSLDSLVRLVGPPSENKKLLCVGSFEDTTALGLKRLGYQIDEIDPLLNYDLSEFFDRPTTQKESYDAVFSVSVIEHVEDDETFLRQMADLLCPEGFLLLTVDFLNTWKKGEGKPSCDFRLYTERDFRDRFLPQVPNCELLGIPDWDSSDPDFNWDDIDYSFASFVLRKKKKS